MVNNGSCTVSDVLKEGIYKVEKGQLLYVVTLDSTLDYIPFNLLYNVKFGK